MLVVALVVSALSLAACGEFELPFGGEDEERSMAVPAAAMAPAAPGDG